MLEHLNIEQKSAITNIITKKDPYPYIIIGPPGEWAHFKPPKNSSLRKAFDKFFFCEY